MSGMIAKRDQVVNVADYIHQSGGAIFAARK
jgi:hypothetical protein